MVLILRKPREKEKPIPLLIDSIITAQPSTEDTTIYSLVMKVRNRVGLLRDLGEYLTSINANIVKIVIPEPATLSAKEVPLVVVVEVKRDADINDLVNRLKHIEGIIEIKARQPIGKLLFPRLFPLKVDGQRALIIPQKAFHMLLEARDKYGLMMQTLFNQIAREIGKGIYNMLISFYGEPARDQDYDLLSKVFLLSLESLGFGQVEIVYNNAKEGEVIFRLRDSIECSKYVGTRRPSGIFTAALAEGFYKELWAPHRVIVQETKCIAKGDPYCEFSVSVTL